MKTNEFNMNVNIKKFKKSQYNRIKKVFKSLFNLIDKLMNKYRIFAITVLILPLLPIMFLLHMLYTKISINNIEPASTKNDITEQVKPSEEIGKKELEKIEIKNEPKISEKIKVAETEKPKQVVTTEKKKVSSRSSVREIEIKNYKVFDISFYCSCKICCGKNAKGITATGAKVVEGVTIAVDPRIIPLGSKVKIEFEGWRSTYNGIYIAQDTGGAIKGNRIDLYLNNHNECLQAGRTKAKVEVIK